MSQGAAPMGNVPGTTNLPTGVQGPTMPASMPAPNAEPPGMWGQISGFLGDTATKFVQSMGDTPEERQQNLELFTKSIGTINQLGSEISQSTLAQRMGQAKAKDVLAQQQLAAQAANMQPLPPMNAELLANIMADVGLGVKGIKEATTKDIRR